MEAVIQLMPFKRRQLHKKCVVDPLYSVYCKEMDWDMTLHAVGSHQYNTIVQSMLPYTNNWWPRTVSVCWGYADENKNVSRLCLKVSVSPWWLRLVASWFQTRGPATKARAPSLSLEYSGWLLDIRHSGPEICWRNTSDKLLENRSKFISHRKVYFQTESK